MSIIKKLATPLVFLFLFILCYPYILDWMIGFYHHQNTEISTIDSCGVKNDVDLLENDSISRDVTTERGTFGDMYGFLNTIFSGLALLGVVYTIIDEKENKKKERLQTHKDKLSYFHGVLSLSIFTIKSTLTKVYTPKTLLGDDFMLSDQVLVYYEKSNFDRLYKLLNSLNEEEYFLSYIENIDLKESYHKRVSKILILFEGLHEIIEKLQLLESTLVQSKDYISETKKKILAAIRTKFDVIETPDRVKYERYYYSVWLKSPRSLYDIERLIESVTEIYNSNSEEITSPTEDDFFDVIKEASGKLNQIKKRVESDLGSLASIISIIESDNELIEKESVKINLFIIDN